MRPSGVFPVRRHHFRDGMPSEGWRWGKSSSLCIGEKDRRAGLSIMRAIEERLRGRRHSRPEAGPREEPTTAGSTSRLPSLSREQEGSEWKVVEPQERRKGQRKGKKAKATEKESRKNAKSSTGPLTAVGEEDEMLAETKCCELN